jgi:hypothetical protein
VGVGEDEEDEGVAEEGVEEEGGVVEEDCTVFTKSGTFTGWMVEGVSGVIFVRSMSDSVDKMEFMSSVVG